LYYIALDLGRKTKVVVIYPNFIHHSTTKNSKFIGGIR